MTTKDYVHRQIEVDQQRVDAVLAEWKAQHSDEFYDISRSRETRSVALKRTRAYHLRHPDLTGAKVTGGDVTRNVLLMKDTPLYEKFPVMREFITYVGDLLQDGWSHVGRVFVSRLDAGASILRHVDEGAYFDELHRFHLVLQSSGSIFQWDNDSVQVNPGELWLMNNSIPHWIENTEQDRTHLIFDAN